MRDRIPELPIFKTVDSAQRIRIVWAFYAIGVLHEFDTEEQAEKARQEMIEHAKAQI